MFIAVVMTVIGVVAHIVKWHTAAIVTGEVHGRAGVEGLARGTTWHLLIFFKKKIDFKQQMQQTKAN